MQNKNRIRNFQADDLEQVAQLFDAYRQFYEEVADLALAKQFISERIRHNQSVILVAEGESGQLDGFCQLYPTFCSVAAKPIYVLYDLFVAQHARGKGIARALLDDAVELAKKNGMCRLDLSTAKTNLTAQSVYEAHGWIRDHEFYSYNYFIDGHG